MKISVDSLGDDKLYVVEAEASRQGRRLAKAIAVKLDSGAVGENWIEPRLVEELGLRLVISNQVNKGHTTIDYTRVRTDLSRPKRRWCRCGLNPGSSRST